MLSIAELIQEADKRESLDTIRARVRHMPEDQRSVLLGYLQSTGASDLARELFGIDSLGIASSVRELHIPERTQIYVGNRRDTGGLQMDALSRRELQFLLQGFFRHEKERDYIIDMMFYQDRVVTQTHGDILDYIASVDQLASRVWYTQKTVLRVVWSEDTSTVDTPTAANDDDYTPLVDRLKYAEPGYFDYLHETQVPRLQYVESLLCEVIRTLADEPRNHIWALDPEHMDIHISPMMRDKIALIRSICEFHQMIDPDFPMLHTLIPSTLASWILVYRGFSAPVDSVRRILGKEQG